MRDIARLIISATGLFPVFRAALVDLGTSLPTFRAERWREVWILHLDDIMGGRVETPEAP